MSLIVSAFAPCDDVRQTWTPQLRTDAGPTALVLIDLARGQARLGGSVLAQVYDETGDDAPDVDDPARDPRAVRRARGAARGRPRARLPRSLGRRADRDALEMAFAGHAGVTIDAGALCADDGALAAALFAEELGAVVQVRDADVGRCWACSARTASTRASSARVADDDQIRVRRGSAVLFSETRIALQRAWSETTWLMQSLRDNPESAQQEYDRMLDAGDPGHLARSSRSIRPRTSPRRSSRPAPGRPSPSCASRA